MSKVGAPTHCMPRQRKSVFKKKPFLRRRYSRRRYTRMRMKVELSYTDFAQRRYKGTAYHFRPRVSIRSPTISILHGGGIDDRYSIFPTSVLPPPFQAAPPPHAPCIYICICTYMLPCNTVIQLHIISTI